MRVNSARWCLFLSVAPAFAQQTELPPAQVEVKGSITSYDARRDDTAMKMVVGREDIGRYGDISVFDVLKRIPGVTMVNNGRSIQLQMRGLGGGYTQLLVDGEKAPAGFSLEDLAPDLVERIEVMRAPSAEFSTQAIAGTVNIVLRKGARRAQEGKREFKLGYLHSSDFTGPSATLDVVGRAGKTGYTLAANVNHESFERHFSGFEDNTRPDGRVDLLRTTDVAENGHINRYSLNPRLDWTLDNGDTLSWQVFASGNKFRNHPHPLVTTLVGVPPQLPDVRTVFEGDNGQQRSELAWTHGFASGAKLEMNLGVETAQEKSSSQNRGMDSEDVLALDDRRRLAARQRGLKSTGKLSRALDGGHALVAGWDGAVHWRDETRTQQDDAAPLPPTLPADEVSDGRVQRLALFAQDEWTIAKAWSAYLGVRWEGIRTDASGNTFATTRVRSSVWSPIAQLLWKIPERKGDQLRLALSRTYKAPELANLLPRRQIWDNNDATEADFLGNPKLKPELAWGVDAAWEHYWAEGAMFSVATTWRRIANYTGNRVYFDGYRWIYTPENVGRATSRSVELDTKFPLKSLVAGAPALDLRASLNRNWSEVSSVPGPDKRIEQQTPLSGTLGVDWKTGAWTTGASFAFRSASLVRSSADRWTYARAGRDLDAYAVWKAGPKVQLRFALANLLRQDNGFEVRYADPVAGLMKRSWTYPGSVKLRTTLESTF
jgi:outer membrane receptor for ferrienterochelin and colicins